MTKWAFVDYENMGSLQGLNLSVYERIVVFCGPQNHQLKLDPNWFGELSLIKLDTQGKNNLDFHLVLLLGRHHETADPATEFHVVSKDGGFDGVVSHLKKMGRVCRRIGIPKKSPAQPKAVPPPKPKPAAKRPIKSLSETALIIVRYLNRFEPRHWPGRKAKSLNQIKSYLWISHPDLDPETIFAELQETGLVWESGDRLEWDDQTIQEVAGPRLVTAA